MQKGIQRESKDNSLHPRKWRERDKRVLFERIKEKYLGIKKLRINLIRVDPMVAEQKRYEKEVKRVQKYQQKKLKLQIETKEKQAHLEALAERDAKTTERGLRHRLKPSDDQSDHRVGSSSRQDDMEIERPEMSETFEEPTVPELN